MDTASLSFPSSQAPLSPQKPPAKQKVLVISLAILSSYTLYDTFIGQQHLLQYGDKLRLAIFFKKKQLNPSDDTLDSELEDSLKNSTFPEHITLLFQTSLPREKTRKEDFTEVNQRAGEILSENWINPDHYSFYNLNNSFISKLSFFLYYSSFLLELPLFFKLLHLDLKEKKQGRPFFPDALAPYATKQLISLLLSFLEKQGIITNCIFKSVDDVMSYPLRFLSKEDKKYALTVLSITLPITFICLLYLRENSYSKGLDRLASIDNAPFPLPEVTAIKELDEQVSQDLKEFFENEGRLANISCQSKDYLHAILYRLDRLNKSKKALGLQPKQAFFYLKLDLNMSNIQKTLEKCLEALEETSCERPILILDKENINSIFKKNSNNENDLKSFLKRIKENEDYQSVKILVIEDSKQKKNAAVNDLLNTFSPPTDSYQVLTEFEEVAIYNLQAVLSDELYLSIDPCSEETKGALKEFWNDNCKSSEEAKKCLRIAQNKLKNLAKAYEKEQLEKVARSNHDVRQQYLEWIHLKKRVNRLKKEQERVVVSMTGYFEKITLGDKKDFYQLLKGGDFRELLSNFLILEKAMTKMLDEQKIKEEVLKKHFSPDLSSFAKHLKS